MAKKEEAATRVRIKIKAYDSKVIDKSAKQIVETAVRTGSSVSGPVPLPTHIKKVTVNKSTFVHKDAREQYEMRTHKRLIDILNPSQKTIEDLTNLDLPAGVSIEVKM
jgi:small subunit ribosomal protein S10